MKRRPNHADGNIAHGEREASRHPGPAAAARVALPAVERRAGGHGCLGGVDRRIEVEQHAIALEVFHMTSARKGDLRHQLGEASESSQYFFGVVVHD
jgi:hypothetical protein